MLIYSATSKNMVKTMNKRVRQNGAYKINSANCKSVALPDLHEHTRGISFPSHRLTWVSLMFIDLFSVY